MKNKRGLGEIDPCLSQGSISAFTLRNQGKPGKMSVRMFDIVIKPGFCKLQDENASDCSI
jgi:hypothetical protein